MEHSRQHLSGKRIDPRPLTGRESLPELISHAFTSYNAGRLREACELLVQKMLQPDVTVGMSLSGALTPAGFGKSCLVPLIEAGAVDWMISTGANLYHDTHHAIGLAGTSLIAAAYRHAVPIFTSSPGDSSIGMNVAELSLEGSALAFDVSADVNQSASI